jgi:release factor glutamine methyltransferase
MGDIRSALKEGMARLRAADTPSHTLAAEVLLLEVLGCDRTWLYTHSQDRLDPATAQKYLALIARRAAGEPTQYLTGKQEFWGLEFEVTPAVLIPRPETEHVLEVALDRLDSRDSKTTGAPSPPLRVADVGTGSGCLAVALARKLPRAEIFATDISAQALEVARRNAMRHGVAGQIHFLETNLLEALLDSPATFDLIVSNPPYIACSEASSLEREVREHEPQLALVGGASGTEIYARLADQAAALLARRGIFVVELGYGRADQVQKILEVRRHWTDIQITNDLAGMPRVLAAERT